MITTIEIDNGLNLRVATLRDGDAWVWSPEWLGMTKQVHFYQRRTFDSGATPVHGRAKRRPATMADVDLAAIQVQMQATIERAKADDPKELRKEITRLKREALAAQQVTPEPQIQRVEVSVLKDEHTTRLQEAVAKMVKAGESITIVGREITEALDKLRNGAKAPVRPARPQPITRSPRPAVTRSLRAPAAKQQTSPRVPIESEPRSKCERAILTILAQHPDGCNINKLALLSGYRISGGFKNALASLRSIGFIEGGNTGTMVITPAGHATAEFEELPTGAALVDYWIGHSSLGRCEREILAYLVGQYPLGINIEDLAAQTGYQISGGFKNALARLRTTGLLVGRNTEAMTIVEELGA